MTLVAITYNPPQISNSKWKKGLSLLTKWDTRIKRKYSATSPTIIAAAKEKVLRHNNVGTQHSSSYIKCEDLTAKEFAQMAGIKIKSTDDERGLEEPVIEEEPMASQMTSRSAQTALSTRSGRHIWDSDFWQDNLACKSTEIIHNDNTNKHSIVHNIHNDHHTINHHDNSNDTQFISQLRSEKFNNLTVPGIIQKGRFKIMVGCDDLEPVSHQQHLQVVLEWKRKRSNSTSTSITPTKK
ncbi:hypothetical protein BDB01DRAFT_774491 [Pilobolus umbonatus]|nr:hypothetical protein BDB01DRAFT_774491 [Pilobolus umbonatus]